MAAIAERVSDYWARQEQKTLVSVLQVHLHLVQWQTMYQIFPEKQVQLEL